MAQSLGLPDSSVGLPIWPSRVFGEPSQGLVLAPKPNAIANDACRRGKILSAPDNGIHPLAGVPQFVGDVSCCHIWVRHRSNELIVELEQRFKVDVPVVGTSCVAEDLTNWGLQFAPFGG